jgi:hypothetical protein
MMGKRAAVRGVLAAKLNILRKPMAVIPAQAGTHFQLFVPDQDGFPLARE